MTAIAAIGNLTVDRVDGEPPRPGGAVFYAARALARLQADVQIAASCAGADVPFLKPALETFGLPVSWHESATTNAYRFHYTRTGRRVMSLDALGKSWSATEATEAVGDAEWVHVGALVRTDFPCETLAALATGSRKLLVDGQGLVRMPVLGPLRSNREIGDVLRHVTLLKLNRTEAETLVGNTDPDSLRALAIPEVIVTLGERGSLVVMPDRVAAMPAIEADEPVDPTGAGDTYAAVYLCARSTGAEPEEAARAATEAVAELLSEARA